MIEKNLQFELISAEKSIFSCQAVLVIAKTQVGELGITPGHTQLLASLKPADLSVRLVSGEERIFYVSGGILEVQPYRATLLSDTILRAEDLDEALVLEAKARVEQLLIEKRGELEYATALAELAHATAQLQTIQKLRKKHLA